MRIVFTMKIASAIDEADVSHNGLFIGLWTEAEVSLGFIVACALCLPKLVQAKGKQVRSALSMSSTPWSSRKSTSYNSSQKSTQHDSRASKQIRPIDLHRPMFYEDREEQRRNTFPSEKNNRHDIYVIPSTTGNSERTSSRDSESRYSLDVGEASTSHAEGMIHTVVTSRPVISRSISVSTREVPVRLDVVHVEEERREEERVSRALDQLEFEYLTAMIDRSPRRSIVR
jgi:hypothetical protein